MLIKIIPFSIFAQCFGLQILTYLLLLPSLLINKINRRIVVITLLLIIMIFSLIIRGADYIYLIKVLQYYGGVLIVYSAFHLNKKIKIDQYIFMIFAGLVISEVLLKIYGYQIFYLDQILLSKDDLNQRTVVYNNYFRALGPSLNSSVSSAILAIGILKANEIRKHYFYLILCLVALMLCWSATGFLMLLMFFIYRIKSNFYKILLILGTIFILFIDLPKINVDYIFYIIEYKINYIKNQNNDFVKLMFGKILENEIIENIGGDSIYLNFIGIYGLILVGIFTLIMINSTTLNNRILIIIGIIVSFHYGVIFNIMGQFVFGALMADKIEIYRKAIR